MPDVGNIVKSDDAVHLEEIILRIIIRRIDKFKVMQDSVDTNTGTWQN